MSTPANDQELVLNAAKACYLRLGVAKTTAADIAQEAGISRATVYRRFPSHEDIFIAVLARDSIEMGKVCAERLKGIEDPVEHIVEGMLIVLDEIPRRPLHAHLFREEASPWVINQTMPAEKLHGMCLSMLGDMPGLRLLPPNSSRRELDYLSEWILRTLISYAMVPSHIARNRDEMGQLLRTVVGPAISKILGSSPAKSSTDKNSKKKSVTQK
jgi:TetR/AcrR family transcriptional regulator